VVFLLQLQLTASVPLWGAGGHEITGLIAQTMLSNKAFQKVDALIPLQSGQLSKVANWADQVRSQNAFKWSSPLHFADVPDWACDFIHNRDCSDDMCVVGAVKNYTDRQNQPKLSLAQRSEALKFFVHFSGDIHQPLHIGFLSNLGGNSLQGTFMGSKTNLHSLWDSGMMNVLLKEQFQNDQNLLAEYLVDKINNEWKKDAADWKTCLLNDPFASCPTEWAEDTAKLACEYAYVEADGKTPIKNNFVLDRDYYERNIDVVLVQLAKSGVRMANVLNNLYSF